MLLQLSSKLYNQLQIKVNEIDSEGARQSFVMLLLCIFIYTYSKSFDFLTITHIGYNNEKVPLALIISRSSIVFIYKLVGFLNIVFFPILLFNIQKKTCRALLFSMLFLICSLDMLDTVGHYIHFFFWSLLPFLFSYKKESWKLSLFFSQLYISLIYFLSGFHKFIHMFESYIMDYYVPAHMSLKYFIAQEYMNTNLENNIIDVFIENDILGGLGFFIVIFIQLSGPFVIIFTKKESLLGFVYIFFHILSFIVLGPDFLKIIPVLFSIYILPNILRRKNKDLVVC